MHHFYFLYFIRPMSLRDNIGKLSWWNPLMLLLVFMPLVKHGLKFLYFLSCLLIWSRHRKPVRHGKVKRQMNACHGTMCSVFAYHLCKRKKKMFFHYWQFYIRIKTLDMVETQMKEFFIISTVYIFQSYLCCFYLVLPSTK